MQKILFVCLGNICRSPTAHAVMRQLVKEAVLPIIVDSAGTSASHRGAPPDARSVKVGTAAGYSFAELKSRPVSAADFEEFDLILAMDQQNLVDLKKRCPPEAQHKLRLLLSYHPQFPRFSEVPDPYYGGAKGFDLVLQLIEQSCQQLLKILYQSGNSRSLSRPSQD